jgi:hypothetical protein
MDSKLIKAESVDISQLLGGDIEKLPQNEELSIPQSPTIAGGLRKPSKLFTKSQ